MPPTLSWLLACRPWPGQIVSGMGAWAYREDARHLCSILSELTYTWFTNTYRDFRFYCSLDRKLGASSVVLDDAVLMEITVAAAFDLPRTRGPPWGVSVLGHAVGKLNNLLDGELQWDGRPDRCMIPSSAVQS